MNGICVKFMTVEERYCLATIYTHTQGPDVVSSGCPGVLVVLCSSLTAVLLFHKLKLFIGKGELEAQHKPLIHSCTSIAPASKC